MTWKSCNLIFFLLAIGYGVSCARAHCCRCPGQHSAYNYIPVTLVPQQFSTNQRRPRHIAAQFNSPLIAPCAQRPSRPAIPMVTQFLHASSSSESPYKVSLSNFGFQRKPQSALSSCLLGPQIRPSSIHPLQPKVIPLQHTSRCAPNYVFSCQPKLVPVPCRS